MHPYRVLEVQKLLNRWCADSALAARFPLYTNYLKSLANTERLNAVHVYLRPLILQLQGAPHTVRFELVQAICRLLDFDGRHAGTSPVEGLPHELLEKIALPTLLEQYRACPSDAYTCVWLAMLPSSKASNNLPESWELLDIALTSAPDDLYIIERRAAMHLYHIDYACHHLPDGLISTEECVIDDITQLRQLAARLSIGRQNFYLGAALPYEGKLRDFIRTSSFLNK